MFRNSNRRVTFRPQHGQQVLVRANITLYEPRGDYQIIVESMQPAGEGLLQQKYEQLKATLSAEGFSTSSLKNRCPLLPTALGLSPQKPVRHCMIFCTSSSVATLPCPSSSTRPPCRATMRRARLCAPLRWRTRAECDVLIVGRGGGSLEDLWSFNDERVARAIFASLIPVVSAVGHETDVTIADFVADLRAPTPSAAAEVVSRNQLELLRQIQNGQQRLEMAMDYFLANRTRRFTQLHHRLQQHPQLRLARQQTVLDRLRQRMNIALDTQLKRAVSRQQRVTQRLNQQNPQPKIYRAQTRIQQLEFVWRRLAPGWSTTAERLAMR
jgi:exodeoxyribonuclease VII large subunit